MKLPVLVTLYSRLCVILVFLVPVIVCQNGNEVTVLFAVNAGGEAHTDVYGVSYEKDFLKDGVTSDFGMRLPTIGKLPPEDDILCRTERYSESSFGYDLPIPGDGHYVLVMKFCEVWFMEPGKKVFNILLNKRHVIVQDLDIFAQAGYGVAHQEVVGFQVKDNGKKLMVSGKESAIKAKSIRLDFAKGAFDNPKVNAFFLAKGKPEDIPPLIPHYMPEMWQEDEDYDWYDMTGTAEQPPKGYERQGGKKYTRSGPPHVDPWERSPIWETYCPIVYSISVGSVTIAVMLKLLRNV